jgi:hypothetical protein
MKPGTLNVLYWIFTILFAALMIFSAVGGIQPSPPAIHMMHEQMGFPIYFIQFISVAKILGVIAILMPGLRRAKEWAYAGLFFDLAGAVYANFATSGFQPGILGILFWIIAGVLSYYYWRKKFG